MAVSQKSFEVREAKFKQGDAIYQSWLDVDPVNPIITKASCTTFISDVATKNGLVISTLLPMKQLREQRRPLVFKIKTGGDPNCLEKRFGMIISYVQAELPTKKAALKLLKGLRKKFTPKYAKKEPNTPPGEGKSPSERSFNSAVGYGKEAIGILTGLGVDYAPQNSYIKLPAFTTFVNSIDQLNIDIAEAMEAYGNAVRNRLEIYDGTNGMRERIALIKNYLAGFEGGKQSPHYIEYVQAVK